MEWQHEEGHRHRRLRTGYLAVSRQAFLRPRILPGSSWRAIRSAWP